MSRITDYIWDFDGTLYDSYPHVTSSMSRALTDLGGKESTERILSLVKRSLPLAVETLCKEHCVDQAELAARFQQYHSDVSHIKPYADAEKCLRGLMNAGCRHFLYTHRDMTASQCLKRDGLTDCFTEQVLGTQGFPSKPAPDAINYLVKKYGLSPQAAVMVGDRDIDLGAARNAGIGCVLFDPDGFYPSETPDRRIQSLTALLD